MTDDMTLEELRETVRKTVDPRDLFGDDPAATLKRFRIICHPDRYLDDKRLAEAGALFKIIEEYYDDLNRPVVLKSPKREYTLWKTNAIGDVADIYTASASDCDSKYIVKISRVPAGAAMLNQEAAILKNVLGVAGTSKYAELVPTLCESFPIKDGIKKTVNVFLYEHGFYTLAEVNKVQRVLHHRHIGWIFKRILSVIGLASKAGIVHGAVLPSHVMVHAVNHGIKLVGWGQSVKVGEEIKCGSKAYMDFYPEEVKKKLGVLTGPWTDIYMAAQCMCYLAGGDIKERRFPAGFTPKLRMFFDSCLLTSPRMRPVDAFALHDEFDDVLRKVFGEPMYYPLEM